MCSNKRSALLVAASILLVFLCVWNLASLEDYATACCPEKGVGSSVGLAGYLCFSLSILLSSRWGKLEDWIGGLDQVYHCHRYVGVVGCCCVLVHPWVEAVKWLPDNAYKFFVMAFPIHGRLSVNIGTAAFWLMVVIVGITLLKIFPYHLWKILHTFMILVFVLATLHILLSHKRFGSELSHVLVLIPMAIGLFGIGYKLIVSQVLRSRYVYEVQNVRYLNDVVVELALEPKTDVFSWIPGQYGFFRWINPALTQESHPFSVVGSPGSSAISLLIKARGDFTKNLYRYVRQGDRVLCEGPYGRFHYSCGGAHQIWIAGGIGIVPFLAWIRSVQFSHSPFPSVDLYYCVHWRKEAMFLEELRDFEGMGLNFRWFLHCSEENCRLNVEKVVMTSGGLEDKKIFLCGPLKLTRDFQAHFRSLGVRGEDIFFEDFEFF